MPITSPKQITLNIVAAIGSIIPSEAAVPTGKFLSAIVYKSTELHTYKDQAPVKA